MKFSEILRGILFIVLMSVCCLSPLTAEVTVSSQATAFLSYGIAGEDQMVPTTDEPGVYDEQKNGFYVDGSLTLRGSVENKVDLSLGLLIKSMSGSPYLPLQMSPSTPGEFTVKLDHIKSRFYLSELLFPGLEIGGSDFMINVVAGKFGMSASDFSFSRFSLDSAVNRLAMANSPALDLEVNLDFAGTDQFYYGEKSNMALNLATGGLFGEDIQRLFDSDGGISEHGKEVLGEYAPQFFADLALNHYVLSFGTISASAGYAYNGSGIYSGHSAGISALLNLELVPGTIFLPVSVSGAFYEKNLDTLGSAADNSLLIDTTDLRETIRIGFAVGGRYVPQTFGIAGPPKTGADLTISGAYSSVGHIYRDTLSLISLAIDGQYYITPKIYVGGGFILGTLIDTTWKTADTISTSLDDYSHTFALSDNFGYEAYAGFDFLGFGTLVVGFAHKQGLSMNYGIETVQNGMVKFRQKDSTLAEDLWETKGIFVKATVKF